MAEIAKGAVRIHVVNDARVRLRIEDIEIVDGQPGGPIDVPIKAGEAKPIGFSIEQYNGTPAKFAAAVNLQKDNPSDPDFLSGNDPTLFDFTDTGLGTALPGTITVQAPAAAPQGLAATLYLVVAEVVTSAPPAEPQ